METTFPYLKLSCNRKLPSWPQLQRPAGRWNEWRVLAKGDRLTLWCNGQKAWEATGLKPAKGYLGLQAEGAALEFRNLRVREIKE